MRKEVDREGEWKIKIKRRRGEREKKEEVDGKVRWVKNEKQGMK